MPTWSFGKRRLPTSGLSRKSCGLSSPPQSSLPSYATPEPRCRRNKTTSLRDDNFGKRLPADAKQSLTSSISLRPGTSSSISGFGIYRLALLPSIILFNDGSSGAGSSEISEFAFFFSDHRSCLLVVGGLMMEIMRLYNRRSWRVCGVDPRSSIPHPRPFRFFFFYNCRLCDDEILTNQQGLCHPSHLSG